MALPRPGQFDEPNEAERMGWRSTKIDGQRLGISRPAQQGDALLDSFAQRGRND